MMFGGEVGSGAVAAAPESMTQRSAPRKRNDTMPALGHNCQGAE